MMPLLHRSAIRFATLAGHHLSRGDEIRVEFTLDDKKASQIEKDAIVTWVKDKDIGCQFTESPKYDKVFGFYLMS